MEIRHKNIIYVSADFQMEVNCDDCHLKQDKGCYYHYHSEKFCSNHRIFVRWRKLKLVNKKVQG
jgi:hypothetical protein